MRSQIEIDLEVEVARDWLIKEIQKNRDEHKALYEKAFDRYHTAIVKHLESELAALKDRRRVTAQYFKGAMPTDHTDDYDLVLSMLNNSTAEQITITGSDFRRFVQDEWDWTSQFAHTLTSYSVSNKWEGKPAGNAADEYA